MLSISAVSRSICIVACFTLLNAQERPFLFTIIPQGIENHSVNFRYDAAYGRETFEPFGGDNIEQVIGMQAGLSESVMLVGRLGFATNDLSTRSSQQVEIFARLLRSEDDGVDVSVGPGFLREYKGTNVLLGRAVIGRRFSLWQMYSNILVEKAFAQERDDIDLFLTSGVSYNITRSFQIGLEAVGQDLEGFWEKNEAEGGATLFIGPTITVALPASPWTFNFGAGPIVRATHSVQTSFVSRDLPAPKKNGFVVHAIVNFGI